MTSEEHQQLNCKGLPAYASCRLCPRECGVNRIRGEEGFCGAGSSSVLAYAGLHKGEEPPISGRHGSGTLFFTGCPLRCSYCQNRQISHRKSRLGRSISAEEGEQICLMLQELGAETINLVTGTHFIPSIAEIIHRAKAAGLRIPVVWNSSGYESIIGLELIDPYIDVYLVDMKTLDASWAAQYSDASYPGKAEQAVSYMLKRNPLQYSGNRLTGGTIIRHLVIPGELENTRRVIRWFSEQAKHRAQLSVLLQFIDQRGELQLSSEDPAHVMEMLEEYCIDEGYIQEIDKQDTHWAPDFRRRNPFPDMYSFPVWHWSKGFMV